MRSNSNRARGRRWSRRTSAGSIAERRRAAVREAARVGAPTIATAVAASAAATLVLVLSPVPMVRGFGVLLAVGIVIAFVCALTVGSAALVVSAGDAPGAGVRWQTCTSRRRCWDPPGAGRASCSWTIR